MCLQARGTVSHCTGCRFRYKTLEIRAGLQLAGFVPRPARGTVARCSDCCCLQRRSAGRMTATAQAAAATAEFDGVFLSRAGLSALLLRVSVPGAIGLGSRHLQLCCQMQCMDRQRSLPPSRGMLRGCAARAPAPCTQGAEALSGPGKGAESRKL